MVKLGWAGQGWGLVKKRTQSRLSLAKEGVSATVKILQRNRTNRLYVYGERVRRVIDVGQWMSGVGWRRRKERERERDLSQGINLHNCGGWPVRNLQGRPAAWKSRLNFEYSPEAECPLWEMSVFCS